MTHLPENEADTTPAAGTAASLDTPGPVATEPPPTSDEIDLDGVERDLNAVEVALDRLAEGTYWTDEITGETIGDDVLSADPTARRS